MSVKQIFINFCFVLAQVLVASWSFLKRITSYHRSDLNRIVSQVFYPFAVAFLVFSWALLFWALLNYFITWQFVFSSPIVKKIIWLHQKQVTQQEFWHFCHSLVRVFKFCSCHIWFCISIFKIAKLVKIQNYFIKSNCKPRIHQKFLNSNFTPCDWLTLNKKITISWIKKNSFIFIRFFFF